MREGGRRRRELEDRERVSREGKREGRKEGRAARKSVSEWREREEGKGEETDR